MVLVDNNPHDGKVLIVSKNHQCKQYGRERDRCCWASKEANQKYLWCKELPCWRIWRNMLRSVWPSTWHDQGELCREQYVGIVKNMMDNLEMIQLDIAFRASIIMAALSMVDFKKLFHPKVIFRPKMFCKVQSPWTSVLFFLRHHCQVS